VLTFDECKTWADKAAALASYAKQSEDKGLENSSKRIKARAISRCGELLKQIEPASKHNAAKREGGSPLCSHVKRQHAALVCHLTKPRTPSALTMCHVTSLSGRSRAMIHRPGLQIALAISKSYPRHRQQQARQPEDACP
jgi:hypothetical protein